MAEGKEEVRRIAELRTRAKAILEGVSSITDGMEVDEACKVVHELHTYQIELEMQNEELRRTQAELMASSERYSDLFEFAPVGYATLGPKGSILEANLTLCDLLAVARESLLQRPFTTYVFPDDQDVFYGHRRETFGSRYRQSCQLRLMRRGAEPFWAKLDSCRFDPAGEGAAASRMAVSDIDECKALEEQLRHAHKMEAVGQLASGVAHQFNNLLVAILGNSQALLAAADLNLPTSHRRSLRDIEKAGKRAASLTRQLLGVARKKDARTSLIDINRTVVDIEPLLRQLVGPSITLETVLAPDLPLVRASEDDVQSALLNMAANARDAMPAGGGLAIRTAAVALQEAQAAANVYAHAGPYARLSVADEGCGMSEDVARRAFEPFFSTKPVGEGTGIGLASVFADVTRSGGFVTVETRVGRGSVFHVHLPAAEGGLGKRGCREDRPAVPCPGGSETILLCDDDRIVLESLSSLLEARGYRVISGNGGPDALKAARAHSGTISLLLTDIRMPGMNGFELFQALSRERPGVKVVYMSGYAQETIDAAAASGAPIEFLQKPADSETLFHVVREALDSRTSP